MDRNTSQPQWWRDRRWQCVNCKREFALERPHRVIDMRGLLVEAWFRCPACGRINQLSRRKLDHYEGVGESS